MLARRRAKWVAVISGVLEVALLAVALWLPVDGSWRVAVFVSGAVLITIAQYGSYRLMVSDDLRADSQTRSLRGEIRNIPRMSLKDRVAALADDVFRFVSVRMHYRPVGSPLAGVPDEQLSERMREERDRQLAEAASYDPETNAIFDEDYRTRLVVAMAELRQMNVDVERLQCYIDGRVYAAIYHELGLIAERL